VAEAMGVKFLAQGNNSSRKSQLGIEPAIILAIYSLQSSIKGLTSSDKGTIAGASTDSTGVINPRTHPPVPYLVE